MRRQVLLVLLFIFFSLNSFSADYYKLPFTDNLTKIGFCKNASKSIDSEYFFGKRIYGYIFKCKGDKNKEIESLFKELGFKTKEKENGFFAVKKLKDENIWVNFSPDDEYQLKIARQIILKNGSSIEFKAKNDNPIYFYLEHPEDKFLSLTVNIPKNSRLDIEIEGKIKRKKLKKTINYHNELNGEYSTKYILYDLPQLEGVFLCSATLSSKKYPAQFKIQATENGNLKKLNNSDKIGGIILKNVPYGSAVVKPQEGVSVYHPDITERDYSGDLTPNGDTIFWLPEGRWTIEVKPFEENQINLTTLKSHLIPVFGGYLTTVSWPAAMKHLFESEDDVKLQILKVSPKDNNRLTVDVSLLNFKESYEPDKNDFEILESGKKGEVISIERLKTPPQIAILLDSSGSMRKSMAKAKRITAEFIKGLPKNSEVYLIDFDTKPKLISKGSPSQALKALKRVKSGGATALYDAIVLGIDTLKNKNRPTLIVFTDGMDSNYNDTARQSKATKQEVLNLIKNSNIPTFTIGFGKNPDKETLSRIATLGKGQYYYAKDPKILKSVFESIKNNLGHQWRITYKRPKETLDSDVPIIAMMIDNSGSMEKKMEKTREILAGFIESLPEDYLVQLFIFSDDVEVKQVLTNDKLALLQGISEMKDLSATNIFGSIKAAYDFLHAIPSTNKYLIYLTDEALNVEKSQKDNLNLLLKKIKDDGIKSLWIGMVDEKNEKIFKDVAKLSNGNYIITPSCKKIGEALQKLSDKIAQSKQSDLHTLRVIYKQTDKYGRIHFYTTATLIPFKQNKSEKTAAIEGITYKKSERLKPYDGTIGRFISGSDAIGRQVQVLKRIPLNISASNKAVKITVKEIVFLSKLKGVEAENGKRFMAMIVKFENILKPQKVIVYPNGSTHPASWINNSEKSARTIEKIPDYLIPDARLHIFLKWNNNQSFPVSEATYLAQTPLILPSENEIYIRPEHPVEGTLIFMVPDEFMRQSSLELYDTAYGHIILPISGTAKITKEKISHLPKQPTAKLSDTFSLKMTGYIDTTKINNFETNEKTLIRIVRCNLISKVQAHLSINPQKRFYLAISTDKGDFFFKLHPITASIPFGLYKPRLITPGSFNTITLAFEIPKALKDNPFSLVVDLKGGAKILNAKNSQKIKLKPLTEAEAEGIKLYVNNIYISKNSSLLPDNSLIVDLTLKDKKDNFSTSLVNFLGLNITEEAKKRLKGEFQSSIEKNTTGSKGLASFGFNRVAPTPGDIEPSFKDFITEFSYETLVLNGQTRRGFLIFELDKKTKPEDYTLSSPIFKNLHFRIKNTKAFRNYSLLAQNTEYSTDSDFQDRLSEAINRLQAIREAEGFKKPGSIKVASISLDKSSVGVNINPPNITTAGGKEWSNIKNINQLKELLKNIRLIPSNWDAWKTTYSPEAVLTQKWATENDLAYMSWLVLNREGFLTKRLTLDLTQKGKKAVCNFFKPYKCNLDELPAVQYEDDNGNRHTLVLPFFKEKYEIDSYFKNEEEADSDPYPTVTVEVSVVAERLSSSRNEALSEMASALASEESEKTETITLISEKYRLKDLSMGFINIGFAKVFDPSKGVVEKAIIDSPIGRRVSKESLELTKYKPLRIELKFYTPDKDFKTVRELGNNQLLEDYFFTVAINTPDLNNKAVKELQKRWTTIYKDTPNPDIISSLKWFSEGVITRFVSSQTAYEKKIANKLNIKLKRVKNPRIVIVTMFTGLKMKKPIATIDIINPYPSVEGDKKAIHSFNIMAGFYYTRLEKFALPNGFNAVDVMRLLPKDTKFLFLDPEELEEFSKILKKEGYPTWMVKHFEDCDNFVIFPTKPLKFGKHYKTAWIEISEDYKVFSYLDTGEKGSITEHIIANDEIAQLADYMVGFWMGVQTSVWSTAAFSLELDNWEDIKTQAHAFARQLANYLTAVLEGGERLKPDLEKAQKVILDHDVLGALGVDKMQYGGFSKEKLEQEIAQDAQNRGFSSDDIQDILKEKDINKMLDSLKGKLKEKYLGFTNGYKDGVDYYFK